MLERQSPLVISPSVSLGNHTHTDNHIKLYFRLIHPLHSVATLFTQPCYVMFSDLRLRNSYPISHKIFDFT